MSEVEEHSVASTEADPADDVGAQMMEGGGKRTRNLTGVIKQWSLNGTHIGWMKLCKLVVIYSDLPLKLHCLGR